MKVNKILFVMALLLLIVMQQRDKDLESVQDLMI